MNGNTDVSLSIFTTLTFQCSGAVKKWEFYAVAAGTFYVGVWRRDVGVQNSVTLIGYNRIEVQDAGHHVCMKYL